MSLKYWFECIHNTIMRTWLHVCTCTWKHGRLGVFQWPIYWIAPHESSSQFISHLNHMNHVKSRPYYSTENHVTQQNPVFFDNSIISAFLNLPKNHNKFIRRSQCYADKNSQSTLNLASVSLHSFIYFIASASMLSLSASDNLTTPSIGILL